MTGGTTRRQFLRTAAAGGVAAGFVTMFGSNAAYAQPKSMTVPERVTASLSATPAGALNSSLPLGAPLADVSKGWDGTVWGIDTKGVPHSYDSLADRWSVYGAGFDVICLWDQPGRFFVLRGAEISITGRDPVPFTAVWKNLPDSFTTAVDGAANLHGVIYLFRNGRYVTIDPKTSTAGPAQSVTSLQNWPTTNDRWTSGAITAVGSHLSTLDNDRIFLWADEEFVIVDMATKSVIDGPHNLDWYVGGAMRDYMHQGFSTILWDESANYQVQAFNGPVVYRSVNRNGSATAAYAAGYLDAWVPVLSQAPVGRAGALWAAGRSEAAFHDGTNWQPVSPNNYNGDLVSVGAGADGSVFALDSGSNVQQYVSQTGTWKRYAQVPFHAAQIAVGDAGHIWLRTIANDVQQLIGQSFTQLNLGHIAVDIAAGSDGTLWHAAKDGRIYRYLAGGSAPSTGLAAGIPDGASVVKVGGTGFGNAYLLSDKGLAYDYDTPYVFKSLEPYFCGFNVSLLPQSVAVAGHTVYLSCYPQGVNTATSLVAAVDAQTGAEKWTRYLGGGINPGTGARVIYDPSLELLYVVSGLAIFALNPLTGKQVWKFDTFDELNFVEGALSGANLVGNVLCVANIGTAQLVAFNTSDALVRAQSGQTPAPLWISPNLAPKGNIFYLGTPAIDLSGTVYAMGFIGPSTYQVCALDLSTGRPRWKQPLTPPTQGNSQLPWDCVSGNTLPTGASHTVPAVFVNAATAVYAVDPATGTILHSFSVPQPPNGPATVITSALAYRHDRLAFGDSANRLWVLDALSLKLVRSTADNPSISSFGITSTPALIAGTDPSAGAVVAFTRGDQHVYFFDPDSGNLDQVATDQTSMGALGYDDAHGVLYAMALAKSPDGFTTQLGQLFALRPDSYVQDERSFIVESQLMQDFASDEEAAGDGVSRYQTHVSMVDSNKVGRANQSVKIWADDAGTVISLDGTPVTVGPDQPASFTTDGTGTFTITSNATDLAATTLRVWAAFMDESERITIIPDAEFHDRLAATTATGKSDPQQIDLVSATSYDGSPLFTDKAQAGQAATAVTQLTSSVGIGSSVSRSLSKTLRATADPSSRYVTYTDLPGAAYTPVAVGVDQTVAQPTAVGIALTSAGHQTLTAASAAAMFDSLTGEQPQLLGGALSSLRSAWHEIKSTAAKVETVVISAAKDVLAGIQYVVNGVTKVVKAVVQDIKDAAAAIGAFFVQLGKDIGKVLQALSKLLNLKKVVETAHIIKDVLNGAFPGMVGLLQNAKTFLDGWFAGAEKEIAGDFCKLYTTLGLPGCGKSGGGPISDVSGMGQSTTTIYNSGPTGSSSRSVESGWSTHTLRTNASSAQSGDSGLQSGADPVQALATVVGNFITGIPQDPKLTAAASLVSQSFSASFTSTSPEQLLRGALQDLLAIFEAMAIGAVALTNALLDALLSAAQVLVDGLQQLGSVKIPVLSALWHAITGNDLTIMDLVSFVLAFPVTFTYYAIEGRYPGDDTTVQGVHQNSTRAVGAATATPPVVKKVLNLAGGFGMVAAGIITAFVDSLAVFAKGVLRPGLTVTAIGAALLFTATATACYTAYSNSDQLGKPEPWTVSLAATSVAGLALTLAAAKLPASAADFVALLNETLGLFNLIFFWQKAVTFKDPALTITREVLSTIPGLVNAIKQGGYPVGLIAPAADIVFRFAAGGIQIAQTIETWNAVGSSPLPSQLPKPSKSPTPPITSVKPPAAPTLANTGFDASTLLMLGVGAVGAGGAAIALARKGATPDCGCGPDQES